MTPVPNAFRVLHCGVNQILVETFSMGRMMLANNLVAE